MVRRAAITLIWMLAFLVPEGDAACRTEATPAADDLLQRVRARILQSRPFRVDFVQQVFVDEEMTLQESGVIVFADRDRIKWQYLKPTDKTFILEDGGYRFFDAENNQLLRGRLGARRERLVWELLFAAKPGSVSRSDAAGRSIVLRLDDENGVQELKVSVGADFLPERVEQSAENEVTTVYLFRNYRCRVSLSDREFDIELPADVEIIEEQAP